VVVVVACSLEPEAAVAQVHPPDVTILFETRDRAENRRKIRLSPARHDSGMEILDRPVVARIAGHDLAHGISDMARAAHCGSMVAQFCK